MPTTISNTANINYTYDGGTGTLATNAVDTTVTNPYTVTVEKNALSDSFVAGTDLTYRVVVTNTGTGEIYNIVLTDNLGVAGAATPMTYVGPLTVNMNNTEYTVTPTATAPSLVITLPSALQPGEVAVITYTVNISSTQAGTLTNTVTLTGNGGSATGDAVTASDTASIAQDTRPIVYAYKTAPSTVTDNSTMTYEVMLFNAGGSDVTGFTVTDTLPNYFTVTGVSARVDSQPTINFAPGEWDVNANVLTVPANSTAPTISIPAGQATTVYITGNVNVTT